MKKVMELAEQIPTRYRVTREAVTDEKTPYITKYAMRLAAKKGTLRPQDCKDRSQEEAGLSGADSGLAERRQILQHCAGTL